VAGAYGDPGRGDVGGEPVGASWGPAHNNHARSQAGDAARGVVAHPAVEGALEFGGLVTLGFNPLRGVFGRLLGAVMKHQAVAPPVLTPAGQTAPPVLACHDLPVGVEDTITAFLEKTRRLLHNPAAGVVALGAAVQEHVLMVRGDDERRVGYDEVEGLA